MSEIAFMIRLLDKSRLADWEALAALAVAINPDTAVTAAELQEEERERDERCQQASWLAIGNSGEVLGMAGYSQNPWIYDPQRFNVSVKVSPLYEGQGIGKALYDHLMNELAVFSPKDLHIDVREDKTRAVRFAESRGFQEEMKEWESRLNVNTFDPILWEEARKRPGRFGIQIRSYAELADDPNRARKLHALESETFLDIPTTVPLTPVPFETFERVVLQSSSFLPDGFQIAIEKATGRYVGSTALYRKEGNYLETGLTGVLRSHRRQGIALALKLRAIDYARSTGISEIRTGNATTNRPMLAINEALGFVKQPVWIWFVKKRIEDTVQ